MKVGDFFKRIFRTGFLSFWRNGVVSLASILIMTVTLLLLAVLIFANAVLGFSLAQVKERVDITIYFSPSAQQSEIASFQSLVEELPEVKETVFVSKEQALEDFVARHENDYLTLQALDELGENPLGAALSVKANDPSQYEAIASVLEGDDALVKDESNIIERINYRQNEFIIQKLDNAIDTIQQVGLSITLLFIIISLIITFNTIRLAIYSAREEIEVMRLVGADNYFIRGPFVVTGLLYGIISSVLALIILYPMTLWLSQKTYGFFGSMDIFQYYTNNLAQILIIMLVVGIILGILASMFAIRRYLRK